jgi:hypothetical protein
MPTGETEEMRFLRCIGGKERRGIIRNKRAGESYRYIYRKINQLQIQVVWASFKN